MDEKAKIVEILKENFMARKEVPIMIAHTEKMQVPIEIWKICQSIINGVVIPYFADALIENGIGDIAEWKEKYARLEKSDTSKEDCTIEQHNEIHYLRNKLKQTEKECTERKARAEVLERALRIEIRKSINQYRSDMAFDTGEFNMPWSQPCFVDNDSKEVEDTIQSLLQQAEKEIEEERKGV